MRKFFRTYIPFTTGVYKSRFLAYKSRSIIWAIGHCVALVVSIFLWIAIFNNSENSVINGFTVNTIVVYVIVSKIAEGLTFVSPEIFVASDVRTGEIVTTMTKPISYRISVIFKCLAQTKASIIIFTPIYLIAGAIFYYTLSLSVDISLLSLAMFFVSVFFALLINLFISFIFSSLVLKTIGHSGVYEFKKVTIALLSGALIPIDFYPSQLRFIVDYMPFKYVRYYPSLILTRGVSIEEFIASTFMQISWLIAVALISMILWNRMKKNLEVYGG